MNSAHDRAQYRRWQELHAPDISIGAYRCKIRDFGKGRVEITTSPANWYQETKKIRALTDMGAVSEYPKDTEELTEAEIARRKAESVRRAVRRAKQNVRGLVAAIEANHMLTLTYRENVVDLDRVRDDWAKFMRKVTAVKPKWAYVCIRERQERGAWHLHVAVNGRQDIGLLRKCWYEVVGEAQGQIDVSGPKRRWGSHGVEWHAAKLSNYMCKYMAKEIGEEIEAEKKRYWAPRGIVIPEKKIWLLATNYLEAVQETYAIARACGAKQTEIFASDLIGVVWVSGSG